MKMKNIKIEILRANGIDFNPLTFKKGDILVARIDHLKDVAAARTGFGEMESFIVTEKKEAPIKGFKDFIKRLERGEFGEQEDFLINTHQETLYPFFRDGKIIEKELIKYAAQKMTNDFEINLMITDTQVKENLIVIKKLDSTISIAKYEDIDAEIIDMQGFCCDGVNEVKLYEIDASRTVHELANGLAYYNYQGNHFRVFNSFNCAMRFIKSNNAPDKWVLAEFDNDDDLDEYLENYKVAS